jgi:hypothetical protein
VWQHSAALGLRPRKRTEIIVKFSFPGSKVFGFFETELTVWQQSNSQLICGVLTGKITRIDNAIEAEIIAGDFHRA